MTRNFVLRRLMHAHKSISGYVAPSKLREQTSTLIGTPEVSKQIYVNKTDANYLKR